MVFAQEGYHNASMEVMARAAGVTKPVLYQHFPSKLDLLRAVATEAATEIERVATSAMTAAAEAGLPFTAAIQALYELAEERPYQFLLVYETELPQDEQVQRTLIECTSRVVAHGIPMIQAQTTLDKEQATLLAWSLIGMSTFAVRHWKRSKGTIPMDTASKLTIELLQSGLSGWSTQG